MLFSSQDFDNVLP